MVHLLFHDPPIQHRQRRYQLVDFGDGVGQPTMGGGMTNGGSGDDGGQRDQDITLEGLSPFALPDEEPQSRAVTPVRNPSGSYRVSPAAERRAAEVQPGARVAARYQIEAVIGTGGMGKVFRARHLGLDKRFALKLMHLDLSEDEETRTHFYREARVASSLAHPNIVSVVDFGEDDHLGAFMVMELLEGTKLSTLVAKEGRLAAKPWCDVMLQLAEATHHIHQHGIVHGDIKPDNVMLCEVPSTDRRKMFVKLLDFGLARAALPPHPNGPNGPRAASISGTPHYMAPERLRGEAPHPSMDIYSVGVVGFELITGKAPFDGSIPHVIESQLRHRVPSFAAMGLSGADETMETLIQRALSKKPGDRQRDMGAFLYELRTLMGMLGMGRRRAVTTARARGGDERAPAADLFAVAPVPQAGVDADGRIIVANRAFAKFVVGDAELAIAGVSVAATRIVEVLPEIMAELRHVHISAQQSRRVVRLADGRGRPVDLVVWMVPGSSAYGDVIVTVYTLPHR
jgi:tRNA A-37 threonylcarbamoyl transferase component Bud32